MPWFDEQRWCGARSSSRADSWGEPSGCPAMHQGPRGERNDQVSEDRGPLDGPHRRRCSSEGFTLEAFHEAATLRIALISGVAVVARGAPCVQGAVRRAGRFLSRLPLVVILSLPYRRCRRVRVTAMPWCFFRSERNAAGTKHGVETDGDALWDKCATFPPSRIADAPDRGA